MPRKSKVVKEPVEETVEEAAHVDPGLGRQDIDRFDVTTPEEGHTIPRDNAVDPNSPQYTM